MRSRRTEMDRPSSRFVQPGYGVGTKSSNLREASRIRNRSRVQVAGVPVPSRSTSEKDVSGKGLPVKLKHCGSFGTASFNSN